MEEIEIKLTYEDKSKVTDILKRAGAKKEGEFDLKDTYFGLGHASMSNANKLVRVRTRDGESELTCKGRCKDKKNVWLRKEINVKVDDGEAVETILDMLGFNRIKSNKSSREVWKLGKTEIAFITFTSPKRIELLEIEGPSRAKVEEIASKLSAITSPAGEDVFED